MVPKPHGHNVKIKESQGVRKSALSPILEIFERLSSLHLKWSVVLSCDLTQQPRNFLKCSFDVVSAFK